ncbi:hypothetical protein [Arsenophonus nasoniae]|uniref:Uncharacterized protein n=2 Tax=Arsenophonus TaxID=637 RepID=A0AA95G9J9_9GAMM|nr:hypothetical protein [Arsenophonus nasoniae]WGL94012.1 hypothetical protein QE207_01325 [Arsenophonus nasoniae]
MMEITYFKKFFSFLKKSYSPRYQLELVDKKRNENQFLYIFKCHGSHECIELNYDQIIDSECFLTLIHPKELILMEKENYSLRLENKKLFIYSENENHEYEIKNKYSKHTYTGNYILKNIDYFPDLDTKDAILIAYNAGLNEGRKLSKKINEEIKLHNELKNKNYENNIINFNRLNHDSFR